MRLFIPACGDRITLEAPWSFTLILERRNIEFAKTRGLVGPKVDMWAHYRAHREYERFQVTLDAGTVLECDRVYVRGYNRSRIQASDDYDSVTWKVIGPKGKPVPKSRFWVKLPDCNSVEFGNVDMYRDRVKLAKLVMES